MGATEQNDSEHAGEAEQLPVGTTLLRGSYTLTRFIASGGFGMTYLAEDNLDRTVVIKECFPASFCCRNGTAVAALSRASEDEFRTLVDLFKTEARNLSALDHPNIVKVHQVFDDNNTAYMVLDYIDGRDLGAAIEDRDAPLKPETVAAMAESLIDAVATIHDADILHRDISPDNILIAGDGTPILIDFGAARQVASATSRSLSAMRTVKDGYSPQEFYASSDGLLFASDLYALAASLHHAIVGYPPPCAQERVAAVGAGLEDPYRPIALQARNYSRGLLDAIDRALGLFPIDRPQTAKEWRQLTKGLRIPNRSARKSQDTSLDLIKSIVDEDEGEALPSVEETLRGLRQIDPVDTPAKPASLGLIAFGVLGMLGLGAGAYVYAAQSSETALVDPLRILSETGYALANGTTLTTLERDGAPRAGVAASPANSPFQAGDELVAIMPGREPIRHPSDFVSQLQAAADAGQRIVNVAVRRDGTVSLIAVDLSVHSILSTP